MMGMARTAKTGLGSKFIPSGFSTKTEELRRSVIEHFSVLRNNTGV